MARFVFDGQPFEVTPRSHPGSKPRRYRRRRTSEFEILRKRDSKLAGRIREQGWRGRGRECDVLPPSPSDKFIRVSRGSTQAATIHHAAESALMGRREGAGCNLGLNFSDAAQVFPITRYLRIPLDCPNRPRVDFLFAAPVFFPRPSSRVVSRRGSLLRRGRPHV